jgi:hypothetical protein
VSVRGWPFGGEAWLVGQVLVVAEVPVVVRGWPVGEEGWTVGGVLVIFGCRGLGIWWGLWRWRLGQWLGGGWR